MSTGPRLRPPLSMALASTLAAAAAFVALHEPTPATAATGGPSAPVPLAIPLHFDEADVMRGERSAEQEQRHEAEFLRRLAGGEMDAERVRQMWAAWRAVPSEPPGTSAVNSWQLAGPVFSINTGGGFMTGRVRDIDAINRRALAATGGLWRFDLFGGIPMCDSVPASWFGSFATHPLDPNTILLGTGEYGKGPGTGLYKTTDGGTTWTYAPMSPQPDGFSLVRWSPDGATAYASAEVGLYRSTDGGNSWTRTLTGVVTDFSLVPGIPGLLFATQASLGVWRSTDDGVSWSQLTGGGVPVNVFGNGAVSAVNFPAGGSLWIYVAFDARIWRSADNGFTWSEVTPGFPVGNSGYGPVISAFPTDPQIVLYGNVGLIRSTNGGASWTPIASPHLHADYHAFAWENDGAGVWAGNDGGWFHSTDRGVTWSSSSNVMPISQFYSIDCEKNVLGYMIGGTQDNNVLYTPSPSLDWIDPACGSTEGDATGVAIDLYDPSQMWAVSGEAGGPIAYLRYRTTDGGTTWSGSITGIDPTIHSRGPIRTDNAFPARLVTSTDYFVYESLDGGDTWTKSNASPFPARIASLTSSTRVAGGAVLYATMDGSTPGQRLYVRDGGTWVERSGGLTAGKVIKVATHPWAAFADEAWAIMAAGVFYHTTDRGVTWTNVTGDFPLLPASDLVPNPRHEGEWYVGTVLGCFRTKNGGVNWEHWNNGMPPWAMIFEMTYIDLTSTTGQFFVVAATYGRSVWKRDVSGGDVFPTLEVSEAFVQEGDAGMSTAWFRVHLPAPQFAGVRVDYATQDGTATVTDNDYVPTSGTIAFSANQVDQWVMVTVNGDAQVEADETFQLVLSNPLRAQVGAPGFGMIQDDDAHQGVSRDLYVTDGPVQTMTLADNSLYIGGQFRHVGTASGGAVPIDAATGLPLSLPRVDGSVIAVAPDAAGGWFLGGSFRHVGGAPRTNLAHVLADGTLAPWNPVANDVVSALVASDGNVYAGGRFTSIAGIPIRYLAAISATTGLPYAGPEPNDEVLALALSGSTLYVGGKFTSVAGKPRNHVAATNVTSGLVAPWDPDADAAVSALLFDGAALLAAGSFTSIGGRTRHYLAALDPTGNTATDWDPAPDNVVFALASGAGVVYAGGAFANIGGESRSNLAALDRTIGHAADWTPDPDGTVLALALSGGTLYVGGSYSNIGGEARDNLAAVSIASGLATEWNPHPNSVVAALGVDGPAVVAAGYFTSLAMQPRASLAAFDATSGQLLPWDPGADGSVLTLAASGGLVYAGGTFTTIGGQPRNRIAALDPMSGAATDWDPNANSTVRTLLPSGTRVFVGGNFTNIGGLARNRAAALLTSDGSASNWNPSANGTVYSLVTDGALVYAGGEFTNIGGAPRSGLAALNMTSGAANPWNPSTGGSLNLLALEGTTLYIAGSFPQRLGAIDLSTGTPLPWSPSPNDLVYSLVPSGAYVYVGGAFTAIGGQWRNHLALLRPSTNQLASWAPGADGDVNALAVSGSTVYVGGAFTGLGGLPQTYFGRVLPLNLVDVPAPVPLAGLALRLSPNPASGPVRIEYHLPEATRVSITVYDVLGRRVGPKFEARQEAGAHATTWDGSSTRAISAGIYFVRFAAGGHTLVRRLVRL